MIFVIEIGLLSVHSLATGIWRLLLIPPKQLIQRDVPHWLLLIFLLVGVEIGVIVVWWLLFVFVELALYLALIRC